jgi:hypothetical protein
MQFDRWATFTNIKVPKVRLALSSNYLIERFLLHKSIAGQNFSTHLAMTDSSPSQRLKANCLGCQPACCPGTLKIEAASDTIDIQNFSGKV